MIEIFQLRQALLIERATVLGPGGTGAGGGKPNPLIMRNHNVVLRRAGILRWSFGAPRIVWRSQIVMWTPKMMVLRPFGSSKSSFGTVVSPKSKHQFGRLNGDFGVAILKQGCTGHPEVSILGGRTEGGSEGFFRMGKLTHLRHDTSRPSVNV